MKLWPYPEKVEKNFTLTTLFLFLPLSPRTDLLLLYLH